MSNKEYTINIDPRILELLGPNLYTNIYYVLAELIANAYDANAKNVYIISDNNSIIVEDDGNGMSYDVGVKNFLNVAHESRTNEENSYVAGSQRKRKKMGRKGVGKLAALSVSENVEIKTIKDGDKSGFVLSRHVGLDHKLKAIEEDDIVFFYVKEHGTSITMNAPQYNFHRTLKAAKNNLLKIFPLVNNDFRIHIQIGKNISVIDSFEKEIIQELGALVTLGDNFAYLHDFFDSQLDTEDKDELESKLRIKKLPYIENIKLKNKDGVENEYKLEIKGWIGAYRTSRGKKKDKTDFPDNFISIISNGKLGEFNVLPLVGKNALNEVFVVGQLHIDLFEDTSLPDMALSNRQGYKSDDLRYDKATRYIRDELLPTIISLRAKYASYKKGIAEEEKNRKNKEREDLFKEIIEDFKSKASEEAAQEISDTVGGDNKKIESIVKTAINKTLPNLGIKKTIDDSKKKLLISHSSKNKSICDLIYNLLIYTGIPSEVIIYTSSDNYESRIPQKQPIFDYLRDFFVNSYSDEKMYVIYVTSKEMSQSWAAVSEVGAGWITQNHHDIFNISGFTPSRPLDVESAWANINIEDDDVVLSRMDADIIAEKLIYACRRLSYEPRKKSEILNEMNRRVVIE